MSVEQRWVAACLLVTSGGLILLARLTFERGSNESLAAGAIAIALIWAGIILLIRNRRHRP